MHLHISHLAIYTCTVDTIYVLMCNVNEENSPNNLLNVPISISILLGLFFIACPVTKYENNNNG